MYIFPLGCGQYKNYRMIINILQDLNLKMVRRIREIWKAETGKPLKWQLKLLSKWMSLQGSRKPFMSRIFYKLTDF
jgi:hypothetical protein